jgi:predicted DNA-binding transcriptional regulator AlpA
MSEEFVFMRKSEVQSLIKETLEDFFAQEERISKPVQPENLESVKKLIGLKEVQKVLGCSAPKLYQLRKANRLPKEILVGKSVFFNRQQFFDFLEKGGTKQGRVS